VSTQDEGEEATEHPGPDANGGRAGLLDLVTIPFTVTGRVVGAVGSAVRGGPEAIGHGIRVVAGAVEEGAERVEELVEDGVELAADVVEEGGDLVEEGLGRHRRVWEGAEHDHFQIEARGIDDPEATTLRDHLKQALEQVQSVRWAEVNAITRRVAVVAEAGTPLSALVAVVESVEEAEGVRQRRLDQRRPVDWELETRPDHPADDEPVHRAIAALAGGAVAMGWTVVGSVARTARVPIELASLVSFVDNQPSVRRQLERAVGKRAVDLVLPIATAAANGVAQGPSGIVVDAVHQVSLLGELRARRAVWAEREREFYSAHHDTVEPPELGPRPVPLPAGPVEQWSERIAIGALVGFGGALAATRDPRRAADAFLAGLPKAARLGREGFATQLGRTLATRGVVPLDGSVLRRLDRVDTVVVDSDVLEDEPAAPALLAAVRDAGHRLVVAGERGDTHLLAGPDEIVPRGKPLGEAVRSLQADGAVVALVARRGKSGLAAADVGIGLTRPTGRPPWGADLVCGHDLADAVFLVEATTVAAEVSRRSAVLAGIGSGLGALVAMTGPRLLAGRRAMLMVNGAAASSLLAGTWAALRLSHRPRPVVEDPTPWHELEPDDVLRRLESSVDGLTSTQAGWRQREERRDEPVSTIEPFLEEVDNPLTPILAVGAGLSAAVGSTLDAALVGGLIGINAVVGGVQRVRADRAIAGLLRSAAGHALVLRDGEIVEVVDDEVVVGDVVRLSSGDSIPADCRLLGADALEVDESDLTGESLPVEKDASPVSGAGVADRRSMLYQGTAVAAGEATAVVVATGSDTEVGRSLRQAGGPAPVTGVEARLQELTRRIVPTAAVAGVAAVGAGLLRRWPARDLFGTGVSLAVASVPEGLPFLASAAQLASARRLAERNAVVRNPRAIEALGRVGVLCFDKTGTLTEGRVELRAVADADAVCDLGALDDTRRSVLAAALRATAEGSDNGGGHSADRALVAAAERVGVRPTEDVGSWRIVEELPFEANRGLHAVLGEVDGGRRLSVKGAPEVVLPDCTWNRDIDRASVETRVDELAGEGYRVLAVAERTASGRDELDDDRVERLEFAGLVAFADPVRSTAADALDLIRRAGVEVVMITGDHPSTARSIARELDLLDGREVLTGSELDALDDDALDERIEQVAVFARVTPSQKVRIVESFQRCGQVVAMTGDGANDAPAIRLAEVGVALGGRGKPAARTAADLVVTDDRLETIIDALVEGRAMWGAVREALAILLGGNFGEIGFTVAASTMSRRAPMSPRQFLLVNLLTDLAPAVVIAMRPPQVRSPESLLEEGPEASLGSALTRDIVIRAVTTGAAATVAYGAARFTGTHARASTVGMISLVGAQLGQTLVAGHGRSPLVAATSLASFGVLTVIVQTPGLSQLFGCRPIGPIGWAQALTASTVATGSAWAASRVLVTG
jgi:cation-transporting P-type ATPase I